MTGVLAGAAPSGHRAPAVRRPRHDDRWLRAGRTSTGRFGPSELGIIAASVVVHAAILAIVVAGTHAALVKPAPEPIPVEVVQQMPGVKSPPPMPEAIKPPAPAAPAPAPSHPDRQSERQDLQDQLAALRAERAALKTEEYSLEQQQVARPSVPGALGPLPDSFQAVALPSDAAGEGEAVGYAALVFSQLAKAKGIGRHMGQPGSAGVRFDINAAGGLVDVELVASSGIPALDAEALATVRKAAPFPAPPQGAQRSFSANVSFVAEGGPP